MTNRYSAIVIALLSAAISAQDGQMRRPAVLMERDSVMKEQLFLGREFLGLPTANSVSINVALSQSAEIYYEYGTEPGKYAEKTASPRAMDPGLRYVTVLEGLKPDTQYYYRMNYRTGRTIFLEGNEHSFHTQRRPGSAFTFAVEADPHLDENSEPQMYRNVLKSIGADKPDFLLDLGDTFMSDKLQEPSYAKIEDRALLFRNYFDAICHSVPLFLVLGNHEGEAGWPDKKSNNRVSGWDEKARLLYFHAPFPDKFFSGNTEKKGNYYSFVWGDALFVALDPYRYTMDKPRPGKSDNWAFTLGKEQYDWLRKTLEGSKAKFKFVFCHQLVGGGEEGRGGVEYSKTYEWGGLNADGSYGFAAHRPGWEKPIHKLLVDNGVNIFFHGHDHLFAKQERDGVIYQEVPQPSAKNTRNPGPDGEYGYKEGIILGSSGYLRVNVSADKAVVEYIRRYLGKNASTEHPDGEIACRYEITPPK